MVMPCSSAVESATVNRVVVGSNPTGAAIITPANTKHTGDVSEAFVTAHLLARGYVVLKPLGDNQRYDLVIDRGSGFERAQVKTALYVPEKENLRIPLSNSYAHRGRSRKTYRGDVELVLAWSPRCAAVYVIDMDKVANCTEIILRLKPAMNNQIRNINLATDYLLP